MKDFCKDIPVRAYVLYVFQRWKLANELSIPKNYQKRSPEMIKQMENVRQSLHKIAVEYLEEKGYSQIDINIILEHECEQETKRILPELKNGENYCGICRMVIKTAKWDKHTITPLHKALDREVYHLHRIQQEVKIKMMMEKK